jgi:hypothetical protein
MPFIDEAAILDAQTIWDDETRQMKVDVIYSGMVEGYVPTWERFPDQAELVRDCEILQTNRAIEQDIQNRKNFFNTLKAARSV